MNGRYSKDQSRIDTIDLSYFIDEDKIKDKELQECLDDLNLMEFSRFNALNLLSEQIEIDYRLNLLPLKKLEEKEVEGAYYCGLTGRYHPNPPESILTERQERSCS